MKDTLLSLGEFLDVLHDAALVVDLAGRIVFANRAVSGIFGHDPSELVGGPLSVLIPMQHRAGHEGRVAAFQNHGRSTAMGDRPLLQGLHRDGREIAVSISLSNMDIDGVRYTIAVVRDASSMQRQLGRALVEAETDALTGLGNRLCLSRRLQESLAGACRPFTLAYLDLAQFKVLNDAHGHQTGDEVLRVVARRIGGHVRETDIAVRMGGDEFVIVFDGLDDATAIAERVRALTQQLDEPIRVGTLLLKAGANIGTATYPGDGRTPDELIARADRAMYEAKRSGVAYKRAP